MTYLGWALAAGLAIAVIALALQGCRLRAQERAAFGDARRVRSELAELSEINTRRDGWLRLLSLATDQAIFLLTPDRSVVWLNREAEVLCLPFERLPVRLSQILQSYEVLELVEQEAGDESVFERQFSRGGRVFRASVLRSPDASAYIALTVRDVTELQRLGRARRDLVANISHDLRTPLSAIQVMVETLLRGAAADPSRRSELLRGIGDQTEALQHLAQEMMDLSMIESGRLPLRLIEVSAAELMEPVVQRLLSQAEHKGLALTWVPADDLRVLADPDPVRRVLQNLLHNAIKFTPAGGSIRVTALPTGEDVRFEVHDTGVGIDPDDLIRIFERFFKGDRTRSEGGTGLGLSIARHIVEGHGGRIWAESAPGHGATFFFTLPRA